MRNGEGMNFGLVAVVGGVWAAIGTGFVAAVVPASRAVLSTFWLLVFIALGVWVVGWVVWQVIAEWRLDRMYRKGNATMRDRLAAADERDPVALGPRSD